MARNIEIKARVADLEAVRSRAASLATAPPEILEQTDTFFAVPRGRLKLRRFADGTGELIAYERPDGTGPRESSYVRCAVREPGAIERILARAVGVRGLVEKRRDLFMAGRTRIHLDEVRGLGCFLEIEVVLGDGEDAASGEREARALMAALGIDASDLVPCAYIDLLDRAGA